MLLALALSALPAAGCTADERPSAPDAATRPAVATHRAHLRAMKGGVQIKRATADEWSPALEGQPLYENDKVRTEAGAGTDIVFAANGSTVHLGGDSLISIAETRTRPGQQRTDLTVLRGRIDAELEKPAAQSLSVTTPSATIQAGREIVFQ
ncbi:FecR domain-containing protein [Myxococcus sp. AM009]|uniref:FecR family protein n=1 Tax=unclassified Myxococcus TaxID=2648731 RepID=UPI0015950DF2|nr:MULTISPECIES: FecR family protein [unclassified Myxococcus]NVJ01706.1 FecR domain-containing protein [Myxococcus sp. AM009]NVJ19492.1 FecR domain-containing protein [Myxococcus sp. AM010]